MLLLRALGANVRNEPQPLTIISRPPLFCQWKNCGVRILGKFNL